MASRIAIIGEQNTDFRPHAVVNEMITRFNEQNNKAVKPAWISTEKLNQSDHKTILSDYQGIWISPGSPYKSLDGALNAIKFSRTRNIPALGTCAGFQHMILEYAINHLELEDAVSAQYNPEGKNQVINELTCQVMGQSLKIFIQKGTRAFEIYRSGTITEHYYCRFGFNTAFMKKFRNSGLVFSGVDDRNEPRIFELPNHAFFLGTLFVPGDHMIFSNEIKHEGHPVINAFLKSSLRFRNKAATVD